MADPSTTQENPESDDALFPSELNTKLLKLGNKRNFGGGKDDWSIELFYDGLPLQLQTPWMRNVFGLSCYQNSNGRTNYSLSWELEPNGDVQEFATFLDGLDVWFKEQFKEMGVTLPYFSSVRPCNKFHDDGRPRFNPTFRVKLKQRFENFDCTLMDNTIVASRWAVRDTDRIQRGDMCRLIIELLPVWSAGGKIGTTWKVVTLQKQQPVTFFRPDEA